MKKLLLSVLALSLSAGSFAQTASRPVKQTTPDGETRAINMKPQIPLRSVERNGTVPGVNALIDIGHSSNALTVGFGSKTALFAHPEVNSLSMIFRNDPSVTGSGSSGDLRYGVSTDGGVTWLADQGPIYVSNAGAPMAPGRYPQNVIYNPSGNTDPANAFISFSAATLAAVNGTSWGGLAHGSGPVNGGTPTANEILYGTVQVPNTMMIAPSTGNSYILDIGIDLVTLLDYVDSVLVFVGTWNAGTSQYDYTLNAVNVPVAPDNVGSKLIVEARIAFAPNSATGYMTLLGHHDFTLVADSNYAPIMLKTTDGGATWTHLGTLALDNIDMAFNLGNTFWTTGFEHDLVVDANGNAHITMAIGPSTNSFSIGTTPGQWGIFDIYTTDQGNTWWAQLLGMPQTFRFSWGITDNEIPEDSRPQAATNWAGDKVFFVWFDTDTAVFATTENAFPDAWAIGYDVTANMWTAAVNKTQNTDADGACSFGTLSPYVLEPAAGTWNLPISIQTMIDPTIALATTTHKYITDVNFTTADFTVAGTPIPLTRLSTGVKENDVKLNSLTVYPNPASGRTNTIAFEMDKTAKVTVELVNAIGQTVVTVDHGVMNAGSQKVNLDVAGLEAGIYLVKVKAGDHVAVQKITVK